MTRLLFDLQRFADGAGANVNGTQANVNAYTGEVSGVNGMSAEMKTYYDTELLENARTEHFYSQFGRRQPLPKGRGKLIEWRKWNTLPNADMLTEGVIPTGKDFGMTYLTSGIKQYGLYVTVSDQLETHAIDDVILGAAEELGASAGETQDISIRNVLMEGKNVLYADTVSSGTVTGTPTARWGLTTANKLTPDVVNKAATLLKKLKAPRIGGKYIAIIHPSVTYDLRSSSEWIEAHKYAAATEIFNGEIGELHGVRFIENTNVPVLAGAPLNGTTARHLTVAASPESGSNYIENDTTSTAPFGEPSRIRLLITETPTADMVGRYFHFYDASASGYVCTCKIVGADDTNKYLWLDSAISVTPAQNDLLLPGEGGGEVISGGASTGQMAVYGCLFLGKDAYGIIDPDGAGMEMIVHGRDEIGGPLNQFSTVGYKFSGGAKILYEDRMVRVECCSAYSALDESNYGI